MEDRIHGGHDGKQYLRGTDVRCRLLAPDMLFTGLERQPVGPVAPRIDRHANEAAGHGALVGVLDRHIGGVRTTVADRNAEALGRTDRDVGAHFPRRLQKRQRQRIGCDGGDCTLLVELGDQAREVADLAVSAGVLEDRAEDAGSVQILEGIADDDLPAERLRPGLQERNRLGMAVLIDEKRLRLGLCNALRNGHGFGCCRRLVEQRGVRDVQPGQIANHGLVVEQGFQPPLTDFRLIGRIGGVPGRVLEDIALDDRRGDGPVVALTDQGHELPVAVRRFAQLVECLALRHRLAPGKRRPLADRRRHGVVDERVETGIADDLQHLVHLGRRRADVTSIGEVVRLVIGKGKVLGHAHQATNSL